MALGLAIAAIGVGLAGLALAYFAFKDQPQQENMKPEGLDSFQVTYNQEGMPLPWVRGVVRLPGNLLWYGNLESEEVTEEVGGKGGGSQEVTTGIKYWIDHWQAICLGPAMLLGIYIDDKRWNNDSEITPGQYTWYNTYYQGQSWYTPIYYFNENYPDVERTFYWSSGNINPSSPVITDMRDKIGEFAGRLHTIAHAWLDDFYVGENRLFMPTIHWIVEGYSEAPLNYANMTTGCNPAAVIYDLLKFSGAEDTDIDQSSFQDAADFWYSKGYGININVNRQIEVREAIQKVLNHVDGSMYVDEDDQYVLKAWKETDTSYPTTIETDDFLEFSIERPDWTEVFTDFRAEYTAADQDYTRRGVRVINSAVRNLLDYSRHMTVDLTGFTNSTAASRRLWEIARKQSYPYSTIQFTTNLKFMDINPGQVITIENTDYGIASAQFRVVNKDFSGIEENKIKFVAIQFLEGLITDTYMEAGDPAWQNPDNYAKVPVYEKYLELPYNNFYRTVPIILCMVQRENYEAGYLLNVAANDTGPYQKAITGTTWSMRCTLQNNLLGAFTYTDPAPPGPEPTSSPPYITLQSFNEPLFDESEEGVLLNISYREDGGFTNIGREELFTGLQLAVCDDEIMAFQLYELVGGNQVRIKNILRGLWGSPVRYHGAGSEIWLTRIKNNIFANPGRSFYYIKTLPFLAADVVPIQYKTEVLLNNIINAASAPLPPMVKLTYNSATLVDVDIWPAPTEVEGAGNKAANQSLDGDRYIGGGRFALYGVYADQAVVYQSTSFTLDLSVYTYFGTDMKIRQYDAGGNGSPYLTVVKFPSAAEQVSWAFCTIPWSEWATCQPPS